MKTFAAFHYACLLTWETSRRGGKILEISRLITLDEGAKVPRMLLCGEVDALENNSRGGEHNQVTNLHVVFISNVDIVVLDQKKTTLTPKFVKFSWKFV